MRITRHAYARSRERIKLNHRATHRVARTAYAEGIEIQEVSGSLHGYLTKLYNDGNADAIRIFAEKVWIFKGDMLVTVYQLPNQYRNVANRLLAKKRPLIKERLDEKRSTSDRPDSSSREVPAQARLLPVGDQDLAEELACAKVVSDGGV